MQFIGWYEQDLTQYQPPIASMTFSLVKWWTQMINLPQNAGWSLDPAWSVPKSDTFRPQQSPIPGVKSEIDWSSPFLGMNAQQRIEYLESICSDVLREASIDSQDLTTEQQTDNAKVSAKGEGLLYGRSQDEIETLDDGEAEKDSHQESGGVPRREALLFVPEDRSTDYKNILKSRNPTKSNKESISFSSWDGDHRNLPNDFFWIRNERTIMRRQRRG